MRRTPMNAVCHVGWLTRLSTFRTTGASTYSGVVIQLPHGLEQLDLAHVGGEMDVPEVEPRVLRRLLLHPDVHIAVLPVANLSTPSDQLCMSTIASSKDLYPIVE
jgi:hypothetical protein